jgi:hypothetical protein
VVSVPADFLQQCAVIVVAFGYVLGGANALSVNLDGDRAAQPAGRTRSCSWSTLLSPC